MWNKGYYHYIAADFVRLNDMGWNIFFFCPDLQVVVRQSIGEIYKCKSITDPHYRLLNLESRYTLIEILPVHNRLWCVQERNNLLWNSQNRKHQKYRECQKFVPLIYKSAIQHDWTR